MKKKSERSLEVLHYQRKQAIKFYLEDEHTRGEIAKMCGLSAPAVRYAIELYESGGMENLEPMPRGIAAGIYCALTEEEQYELCETMQRHWPAEFGLNYGVWSGPAVREWISLRFKVKLYPSTVHKYLKRLGMTCQKPVKRAYEQDPEAVANWEGVEMPKILENARQVEEETKKK